TIRSSIGISRSPRTLRATARAPSASSIEGGSEAWSASARTPPTVAWLRTRALATTPKVAASAGQPSRTAEESSTARCVVIAPSRSSPFARTWSSPGTSRRLRKAAGASSRWLTMIPTNVPPATTVASSPCSALNANASSRERGASHLGSLDSCDRLLVQRLRELPCPRDLDSFEHPARLGLRALAAAAAARVPAHEHVRIHLQERERVGRLDEILVRAPARLVRDHQPLDLDDERVCALGAQPVADDPSGALRVQAAILTVLLGGEREVLHGPAREVSLHVVCQRGEAHRLVRA